MLSAALTLGLASSAAAGWWSSPMEQTRSITKRCEGDVLPKAQFSAPLVGKVKRPDYKHGAFQALAHKVGAQVGSYNETVTGSGYDEEYIANITIGGQDFTVIVDTGSSDTWLVKSGFSCFNLSDVAEPQAACNFGGEYKPSSSKTYVNIPNTNFNISYGDGEYLTGTAAYETVEIAGLKVTKQTIGVVDKAAWNGDGVSAGLMGLAYPGITSFYNVSDPTEDEWGPGSSNWNPTDPLFFTAVAEGAVTEPLFSIALNRGSWAAQVNSTYDPNLGYLAFGGIAPVEVTNLSAVVDLDESTFRSGNVKEYAYYMVNTSYEYDGTLNHVGTAILDTGTTLNYMPNYVAKHFNADFSPKATWNGDYGLYFVHCDAKAPEFNVVIGGKSFTIDPRDQVVPIGTDDDGTELCISGTQPGGTVDSGAVFVLGDVFLHNVVMTANPVHNEVTLTQRAPY